MRDFILLFILIIASLGNSIAQKECASYNYYLQQSLGNPVLVQRMEDIESFIQNRLFSNEPRMSPAGFTGNGMAVITIPVVVHVLYNSDDQKITEEQVRTQVEVLNRDFRKLNPGAINLPDYFKPVAADCFIEFNLATVDPGGKPSRGIIWKKTGNSSFGSDDKIKFSKTGGDDAWDPAKYLNIWVGKLSPGIVGYSSAPGSVKEKDGIVLRYTAFGTTGTVLSPYNLGRTAVHETGHWLGLKHIWGDRYCGDDGITDTPPQKGPTPGCPSGISASCDNAASGSMYMNYMDVTHDACTEMFTNGQRDRMRAMFADGGPRHGFVSSSAGQGPLLPAQLPTDTISSLAFRIFPNPANQVVTLKTADLVTGNITIHNQLGQIVMQSYINSTSMQLNIGALQNGIYFIRIGAKGKMYKLVKG